MVKERLRAKIYERYMDDFYIISSDKAFLQQCLEEMRTELAAIGMHLHPKKTRIFPLRDGIKVLGFTFRLTDTGKVIRIIDPKNVKHERKKLARMAVKVQKGEISTADFYAGYEAWKAHARAGNSWKLLQRMDEYVKQLMKGNGEENGRASERGRGN